MAPSLETHMEGSYIIRSHNESSYELSIDARATCTGVIT